jgi:hypothetical protein
MQRVNAALRGLLLIKNNNIFSYIFPQDIIAMKRAQKKSN